MNTTPATPPIGATVTIQWKDNGEVMQGYFVKFSHYNGEDAETDDPEDINVFWYASDEQELKDLQNPNSGADFVLLEYELEYGADHV